MASNLKVDIVKPTATNGSLSLKGDSGGSATSNGISVDSSGNTSITGTTTIATADINGGAIDGTTIGGTTPAAGSFTDMEFNSGYGSVATAYGCRAWVNFDGGSVTFPGSMTGVNASANVSSVTDNGTGDYTVTFTNAMPDANYSISGSALFNTASFARVITLKSVSADVFPKTTEFRINTILASTAAVEDCLIVTAAVFR